MHQTNKDFIREITETASTTLTRCFSCSTCSAGCHFSELMDFKPHEFIRLVQLGYYEEALSASTPWICVGCNTCSTNCPNAIDIPAVMDAVRQKAIAEKRKLPEPDIMNFHTEVMNSIHRYGRTHKLEIMLRYKLVKKDWFSDMDLGVKMLAKRKLDLMPSKIVEIPDIRKLFKKAG